MSEFDTSQFSAEGLRDILQKEVDSLAKKHNLATLTLLATYMDENARTRMIHVRTGNYYANYGSVRQWLIWEDAKEDETARQSLRKTDEESP
jgi:hypothetical protein